MSFALLLLISSDWDSRTPYYGSGSSLIPSWHFIKLHMDPRTSLAEKSRTPLDCKWLQGCYLTLLDRQDHFFCFNPGAIVCRSNGYSRHIWSLGASGEGSGWDPRDRSAPLVASLEKKSWEPGELQGWNPKSINNQQRKHYNADVQSQNTVFPKCRQGPNCEGKNPPATFGALLGSFLCVLLFFICVS